MANLEIVDVIEDVDPSNPKGPARLRVQLRDIKPASYLANLKNCNAEQIAFFKKNVGAIVSVPTRNMMQDGRFAMYLPATDEDYFILKPAEAVKTSGVVELSPADSKPADKAPLKNVG
jgi:hypothetical protein